MAPGTTVYAVKVLDADGDGSESGLICGIDWVTVNAARLNIKVANGSLGGSRTRVDSCPTTADSEHQAICNTTAAGVTYAVAAGTARPSTQRQHDCTRRLSRGVDRDRHVGQRRGAGRHCRGPELSSR